MVECVCVWPLQTDNHQTHYNFIFTLNITFTVTLFMLFGSISSITSGGDQTNSTLYLTKSCVYVLFFFSPGGPTVYYVQNCVSKFMNQKRFVNWLRYTTHNKRNVTQQRETKKNQRRAGKFHDYKFFGTKYTTERKIGQFERKFIEFYGFEFFFSAFFFMRFALCSLTLRGFLELSSS